MGKHDVVDFNRGMIVWGIWAGLSLSETDDLQGFFTHGSFQVSSVYTE